MRALKALVRRDIIQMHVPYRLRQDIMLFIGIESFVSDLINYD